VGSSWDCFPRQNRHGEGEDEEGGIMCTKNKLIAIISRSAALGGNVSVCSTEQHRKD